MRINEGNKKSSIVPFYVNFLRGIVVLYFIKLYILVCELRPGMIVFIHSMECWNWENISLSKQKIVKGWGDEAKKKEELTLVKLGVTRAYITRRCWTENVIVSVNGRQFV